VLWFKLKTPSLRRLRQKDEVTLGDIARPCLKKSKKPKKKKKKKKKL
jgi:hypothetical protein